MRIGLSLNEVALLLQVLHNSLAALIAVHAVVGTAVFVDGAVIGDDPDHLQVMPQANLKVVGVMCGSHLHRTGTEADFAVFVAHNGDLPVHNSIRYTKQLPDANYWTYSVTRSECGKFKGVSADFSAYDSFDFILLKDHREPTEVEMEEVKQNWEYLKEMNVGKANYLCKGKNTMPASKEDILQDKIFNSQVEQYVNTEDCKVAVLNAFPIFLFDYFK